VRAGAQDYLAKDGLDEELLRRTLRHAVERGRLGPSWTRCVAGRCGARTSCWPTCRTSCAPR
jgi:hypothetical protein